jgi:uncharacterized protein (TIGR04222 family)
LHNLIADMPGPMFLFVYGLVIVLTLTVCWSWLRQSDPTASVPAPRVPSTPDPYEIAYLRGGENEVLRVVLFRLLQQGALQVIPKNSGWFGGEQERIERGNVNPTLSPLEKEIFKSIARHTAQEIFQDTGIRCKVKESCNSYEQRLQGEQFLVGPEAKNRASETKWMGALLIAGLGGYKLIVALAKGHSNVLFLIWMGVVAVAVLHKICSPRLTFRGRQYLQNLKTAFGQWKEHASLIGESQLFLLVGIFGATVLSGTTYDYFRQMFSKGSASGGGCGGGCDGCGGCGGCGGCA